MVQWSLLVAASLHCSSRTSVTTSQEVLVAIAVVAFRKDCHRLSFFVNNTNAPPVVGEMVEPTMPVKSECQVFNDAQGNDTS